MSLTALHFAWILILSLTNLAQGGKKDAETQPERRPVFGRTLDAEGRPVAGVEVHMVSNLVAGLPELGNNDVISLVSDERGRFRARLLLGRNYSAWAWQTRKGGSRWTSGVQENVRPGPALDFSLTIPQPGTELSLMAGKDGRGFGKAVYTLGGSHFVLRRYEKAEREDRVMPRLAGSTASMLLHDEQGHPVLVYALNAARSTVVITMPHTRTVSIRAVFGSQPIRGARVLLLANPWVEPLATTDENGRAVFRIAGFIDTRRKRFNARMGIQLQKPGYVATRFYVRGDIDAQGRIATCDVLLQPGRRLEGRWLDAHSKPLAKVPLVLYSTHDRWSSNRTSQTSSLHPLAFHTDTRGRFDLSGFSRRSAWRLMAFPPGTGTPVLVGSSSHPPTEDLDLGDLRIQDFVRLDLSVQGADHRPIRKARLALGEAGSARADRKALSSPFWLFPDRRGQASLLCRKGLRPAFAAASPVAFAEMELDAPITDTRPTPLVIRLPELIHLRGRLVHEDIKNYRNAKVFISAGRAIPHKLKVSSILRSPHAQDVHADGSFDIQALPGIKIRLRVTYLDRSGDSPQYYSGFLDFRSYEEDTDDIRIELKSRGNIKRRAVQIGIGGRR